MTNISVTKPYQKRRRYSKELKARIVAECLKPGASVSRISLDNGLNANMVRRWMSEARRVRVKHRKHLDSFRSPSASRSACAGHSVSLESMYHHPHRNPPRRQRGCGGVACGASPSVCGFASGSVGMIRIDEIWLATEPLDMRAGPDKALARVIQVFGSAKPHCAYLFANKRGNRMKVLIHDGLGIWLCARRLNRGKFHWGETWRGDQLRLTEEQLSALVQGLPWQRIGAEGVICIL